MNFEALDEAERGLVGQALHAAVSGPFFLDWEFHTLFGLERGEVLTVANTWPTISDRQVAELAVNNALANLWGYPHGCEVVWSEWISATPGELEDLLDKLRAED